MIRQFSNLGAILRSFYSKALYRDVKKNWPGIGAGYLFVVLLIVSFLQTIVMQLWWHDRALSQIWQQVPSIQVVNGKADAGETTVEIKNAKGKSVLLVDTTKVGPDTDFLDVKRSASASGTEVVSVDDNGSEVKVHVAQDGVYVKARDGTIYKNDYASSGSALVEFGKITHHGFSIITTIVLFPFVVFFSYITCFIIAILLSIVAKIFSWIVKVPLSCSQAMRLAIVAMTPLALLGLFASAIRYSVLLKYPPHSLVFWITLYCLYVFFAVYSNRQQQ